VPGSGTDDTAGESYECTLGDEPRKETATIEADGAQKRELGAAPYDR